MAINRYPPGPKNSYFIGNAVKFYRDPIAFLQNITQEHGDIVYISVGPIKAFVLNHPDYIKEVLVTNSGNFVKSRPLAKSKVLIGNGLITSDGAVHMRQRRLVQPAFHRKRIAAYGNAMSDLITKRRGTWEGGSTVDISQEMMTLSMSIVAKTLFDIDIESEAQEIGDIVTLTLERWRKILVIPFSELIEKLPFPGNRYFYERKNHLDSIVYKYINERRASGKDRGDLLSMLLLATDEEGDGGGMTDLEVRDQVMTILMAGHETITNAMTWTWYLISQHPEVEAKLHAELDSVLSGRDPTPEDVQNLKYTRMVLAESMRLYPPVWIMGRQPIKDYTLSSYTFPAGSWMIMSQFLIHRDPRFYPDPLRFDPDRWAAENQNSRPQFAYFPFGGGPRLCIGEQYAWLEGILIISSIAQKWRLRLEPGHPIELQPMLSLRPKYGMRMLLERR